MAARRERVNALPSDDFYSRPGFLLRRAQQIAVGIFLRECAEVRLTPTQHGVLVVVNRQPGISQADLARAMGVDQATTGKVVEAMQARRLLRRSASGNDRRNYRLELTGAGARFMARAAQAGKRTSERLLSPFSPAERDRFLKLLARLTTELNDESRTPVSRAQRKRK